MHHDSQGVNDFRGRTIGTDRRQTGHLGPGFALTFQGDQSCTITVRLETRMKIEQLFTDDRRIDAQIGEDIRTLES